MPRQPARSRRNSGRWLRYWLPGALLVAAIAYHGRLLFAPLAPPPASADWAIGAPLASWVAQQPSRSTAELQAYALELVNRDRAANGLPPLETDLLLSAIAQTHAEDMLARNYYGHETPEGLDPSDRLAARGGRGGAAENIARISGSPGVAANFRTLERLQRGWMASDGHRRNLLDPAARRFGFGIASDPLQGRLYAVQNFSGP